MTYKEWKSKNDALQKVLTPHRILDYYGGKCYLSNGYSMTDFNLVVSVLQSKLCVTNPSKLASFDFHKLDKRQTRQDNITIKRNNEDTQSETIRERLKSGSNVLYHGSKGGLKGKIRADFGSACCDFGQGFYLGTMLEQAENRVNSYSDAYLYGFRLNKANLKEYIFTDGILWALVIGYYRYNEKLHLDAYKGLMKEIKKIETCDVVTGLIADDKISFVYDNFMSGDITDECLIESLKYVNYGNQVVLRTQKAVNNLSQIAQYHVTKEMRKNSIVWNKEKKDDLEIVLDKLKKQYRRKGRYVDEILGEYE